MSLKKIISQIKWFEYVYMSIFLAVLVALSVIFKSSWLVTCNSVFGVISVFFIAKGLVVGNVIGIVQLAVYAVVSFQNRYYGEIFVSLAILLPCYIAAIFTWTRNRNKNNDVVQVIQKISLKEWLVASAAMAAISVAMFFVLKALHTDNLYFSWGSVVLCLIANYLVIRRSEYNFIFFLISNIATIALWLSVVLKGDLSYIPIIANYFMFMILNLSGVVNWIKIKSGQKTDEFKIIMAAIKEK